MTAATTARPALRAEGLGKHFGGVRVFEALALSLAPGEVLGIIGPNGAGKTTLINVLSGQIPASEGRVLLGAEDVTRVRFHHRSRMGLVRTFQQTRTFGSATVAENLARARSFAGHAGGAVDGPVAGLMRHAGLEARRDQVSDTLPYGMQKMLGLLMGLASGPSVMMLDEPAAGLESEERQFVDAYVEAAVREVGAAVLLVEHDMELVRRLCPRLCVLNAGRFIAEGETAEVLSRPAVIEAYMGTGAAGTGTPDMTAMEAADA